MNRRAWIFVAAAVVILGIAASALVGIVGRADQPSAGSPTTSSSSPAFELPLGLEPSTLALAQHRRDLLVGLAARKGGPVEVAAVRAEGALAADAVEIAVDGSPLETRSCGTGCSRVEAPVLEGRAGRVTVKADGTTFSFLLPPVLPRSGQPIFDRALRRMDALHSFRFTESLSSGRSALTTKLEAEAPNRLRLRTSNGYRSVIIGKTRWDYDGHWQRRPFPGLAVSDLLMWHSVKGPRVLQGGPTTTLAAFALEPVPSWFRLTVRSGRVVEAQMLAPSHFMTHRYSDFNAPIRIEPPR